MIGIFGGTFDPVHLGHLEPAHDVMEQLGLDKVLFIPNNVPPHREQPELKTAQRVELLQLALLDYPGFELDLREVKRSGPSYMVDTLVELQRDYPGETLCLILGMDAFLGLQQWYRWQSLFDYCHLVVTARPGFNLPVIEEQDIAQRIVSDAAELAASPHGKILIKSVSLLDVSASEIRRCIESGESASQLMPAAVYDRYREIIGLYAN